MNNPFNINISQVSGVQIEDGTYPARGLYVIDLGRQQISWNNQQSIQHQIILGFEIYIDDATAVLSRKFSLKLGKKANLRKIVESWLGCNLDEMEELNLIDLLGKECLVQVQGIDFTSQLGESIHYSKVVNVTKPPKGYKVPEPEQTPFYFTVIPEMRDMKVYEERLTERQKALCLESEDWTAKAVPEPRKVEEFEDEIPF